MDGRARRRGNIKVNSVTGELAKDELGIITPHEHIFIDLSAFFEERPLRDIEKPTEK